MRLLKHLCEGHFVRKSLVDIKEREERQPEIESTIEERKRYVFGAHQVKTPWPFLSCGVS